MMVRLVILVILITVGLAQEAAAPQQIPILAEAATAVVDQQGKW